MVSNTTWSDGESAHLAADLHDLAHGFVAKPRGSDVRRDPAVVDVHGVRPADAARLHLDEHVLRTGDRCIHLEHLDLVRTCDHDAAHVCFFIVIDDAHAILPSQQCGPCFRDSGDFRPCRRDDE